MFLFEFGLLLSDLCDVTCIVNKGDNLIICTQGIDEIIKNMCNPGGVRIRNLILVRFAGLEYFFMAGAGNSSGILAEVGLD